MFFGEYSYSYLPAKHIVEWGEGLLLGFEKKSNKVLRIAVQEVSAFLSTEVPRKAPENWWTSPPSVPVMKTEENPVEKILDAANFYPDVSTEAKSLSDSTNANNEVGQPLNKEVKTGGIMDITLKVSKGKVIIPPKLLTLKKKWDLRKEKGQSIDEFRVEEGIDLEAIDIQNLTSERSLNALPDYLHLKQNQWVSRPRPKRLSHEEIEVCSCKPAFSVRDMKDDFISLNRREPSISARDALAVCQSSNFLNECTHRPKRARPHFGCTEDSEATRQKIKRRNQFKKDTYTAFDGTQGETMDVESTLLNGNDVKGCDAQKVETSSANEGDPINVLQTSSQIFCQESTQSVVTSGIERTDKMERIVRYCCGGDCLNRLSFVHCDSRTCPAGEHCSNLPFHKLQHPPMEVFLTRDKGWGVRAIGSIPSGSFVAEYVGEIVDEMEMHKRMEAARLNGDPHFYMMELCPGLVIDAKPKGNVSRLLNSSCEPNCETQKWRDAATGEMHVGIFTKKDVYPGEELCYNYNFQQLFGEDGEYMCKCGAPSCLGSMDSRQHGTHIGRKLELYWSGDRCYYSGKITKYDPSTKKHEILYDDGEVELVSLEKEKFRWIDGKVEANEKSVEFTATTTNSSIEKKGRKAKKMQIVEKVHEKPSRMVEETCNDTSQTICKLESPQVLDIFEETTYKEELLSSETLVENQISNFLFDLIGDADNSKARDILMPILPTIKGKIKDMIDRIPALCSVHDFHISKTKETSDSCLTARYDGVTKVEVRDLQSSKDSTSSEGFMRTQNSPILFQESHENISTKEHSNTITPSKHTDACLNSFCTNRLDAQHGHMKYESPLNEVSNIMEEILDSIIKKIIENDLESIFDEASSTAWNEESGTHPEKGDIQDMAEKQKMDAYNSIKAYFLGQVFVLPLSSEKELQDRCSQFFFQIDALYSFLKGLDTEDQAAFDVDNPGAEAVAGRLHGNGARPGRRPGRGRPRGGRSGSRFNSGLSSGISTRGRKRQPKSYGEDFEQDASSRHDMQKDISQDASLAKNIDGRKRKSQPKHGSNDMDALNKVNAGESTKEDTKVGEEMKSCNLHGESSLHGTVKNDKPSNFVDSSRQLTGTTHRKALSAAALRRAARTPPSTGLPARTILVAKRLTNSDVTKGRILLPRAAVEANLSFAVGRAHSLKARDHRGDYWEFTLQSWANGVETRRVYVLEHAGDFIRCHALKLDDVIGISTTAEGIFLVEYNTDEVCSAAETQMAARGSVGIAPPISAGGTNSNGVVIGLPSLSQTLAQGSANPLIQHNDGRCTRSEFCNKPAGHPGFCLRKPPGAATGGNTQARHANKSRLKKSNAKSSQKKVQTTASHQRYSVTEIAEKSMFQTSNKKGKISSRSHPSYAAGPVTMYRPSAVLFNDVGRPKRSRQGSNKIRSNYNLDTDDDEASISEYDNMDDGRLSDAFEEETLKDDSFSVKNFGQFDIYSKCMESQDIQQTTNMATSDSRNDISPSPNTISDFDNIESVNDGALQGGQDVVGGGQDQVNFLTKGGQSSNILNEVKNFGAANPKLQQTQEDEDTNQVGKASQPSLGPEVQISKFGNSLLRGGHTEAVPPIFVMRPEAVAHLPPMSPNVHHSPLRPSMAARQNSLPRPPLLNAANTAGSSNTFGQPMAFSAAQTHGSGLLPPTLPLSINGPTFEQIANPLDVASFLVGNSPVAATAEQRKQAAHNLLPNGDANGVTRSLSKVETLASSPKRGRGTSRKDAKALQTTGKTRNRNNLKSINNGRAALDGRRTSPNLLSAIPMTSDGGKKTPPLFGGAPPARPPA